MNDSLPTEWPAEGHTLAKHAILRAYLDGWLPILIRNKAKTGSRGEVLYVDGFAGPGKYEGGEDGSPIIALKAAMEHEAKFPFPVRYIFIELDPARHARLCENLNAFRTQAGITSKALIETPICGDCNLELTGILTKYEARGVRFGPALVFLDQFGYSAVPITLIAKIMNYPSCEVFSYLEYRHLNRFITDPTKHAGIDNAFGGSEWREAINLPDGKRDKFLLETYKTALKSRGGVKFVANFNMYDTKGQLLYWLFFCTGNLRGLEVMKKAMWKVDGKGTFRFSDGTDEAQGSLFLSNAYTQEWLAEELSRQLHGQTHTVAAIREFVLVKTPCYLFRDALFVLEKSKRLLISNAPAGRRMGTFADELLDQIKVTFVSPPQSEKQESLFG